MANDISEATMIPEIFAIRYPQTRGFRTWCHGKKLGELELLLPVWEEKELYEHCAVMLAVIKAKQAAKTRIFHETTLKPEGD